MIAIVILGLGMIMVATMFPVAWTKVRKLSDVTTHESVVDAAHETVKLLAGVDGLNTNASTFAGDLVYDDSAENPMVVPPLPGVVISYADNLVHALHMENLLVTGRRIIWEQPWRQEKMFFENFDPGHTQADPTDPGDVPPALGENCFLTARVRFESRVSPPLRLRARSGPLVFNAGADPAEVEAWDETLDTRRYAWAALHRMRSPSPFGPAWNDPFGPSTVPPYAQQVLAENEIHKRRDFDIYYVTLRRPQPTYRYARQDPGTAPNPRVFTIPPALNGMPKALPPTADCLVAVPWRVQVYFPTTLTPAPGTGVPTEMQVNTPSAPTTPMVVDMFSEGTPFIDERTGNVYHVVKRRLIGPGQDQAFLTLDREVLLEDVEEAGFTPGVLDPEEQLRTVWVFPPPAQETRAEPGVPIFDGPQPVVGIEMRTLSLVPPG